MSWRRAISIRWIVQAACVTLVCVLSAETTARVDDLVRDGVPLAAVPDLNRDLVLHDSLGSRGRPYGRYQRWRLNSAGFRSDESALTPRPGCTRVMTLGSSETFGAGGEGPNKEYPAQLGDSLSRYGCYQVMNAAIVGTSIPGIIQLWNTWASRFRPDVVVILANPIFYLGDNAPAHAAPRAAPAQVAAAWWTPRLIEKAHQVLHYPAFIQRRRIQHQLDALVAGRPSEWFYSSVPLDRLTQYGRDLDSLVAAVRSHGVEPVLAVYPMRFGDTLNSQDQDLLAAWRVFSPRAQPDVMLEFDHAAGDVVRALGRERKIRVVDLASTMNGHREWFDDFIHYTDAGAGVVAGAVGDAVRAASSTQSATASRSP